MCINIYQVYIRLYLRSSKSSFQAARIALLCRSRCYAIRTCNAIHPSTRRSGQQSAQASLVIEELCRVARAWSKGISLFVELSFLPLSRSFARLSPPHGGGELAPNLPRSTRSATRKIPSIRDTQNRNYLFYISGPLIIPSKRIPSNYLDNWPSKINCVYWPRERTILA